MDKVCIGIIGTGQIAHSHVEEYLKIPGVEITAVAGRDEGRTQTFAEAHQIANYYTDFRKLLERDDVIAIDVCLHNNLHMPVTTAAFTAGKHVYCEKPIAGSYADGLRMVQAAQQAQLKLSIQLSSLFRNETKAAKTLIDQGALGHIYHARSVGYRRRGRPFVDGYGTPQFVQKEFSAGGAVFDMGIYHLAVILYLIGNPEVKRISGKTYQEIAMDPVRRESSGYNVEEMGVGLVRLDNNISLDIIETWAINIDSLSSSMVLGSNGGILLDPFTFSTSSVDLPLNATADFATFDYLTHHIRENADVYDSPQQHWVAALQGRVDLLPTAEIALNAMLISEGIYFSEKLDREVTADEVEHMSISNALSP